MPSIVLPRFSDLWIYVAHMGFWAAFAAARFLSRSTQSEISTASAAEVKSTARHSRLLVGIHVVAFGVLYTGVGFAVFTGAVNASLPAQRIGGAALIVLGAVLAAWAVIHFRSWRFRASLSVGHELATGGPFAFIRHPIYAAMNLLAIGTALWVPSLIVWIGVALMLIGSDLRGRAEEALLGQTFGPVYGQYLKTTWRFLPWIY